MKRFKIIACFLLTFFLTFSEESSVVAEQKARIAQLEQQIETQNKIIARYEKLEDKIDSRISQSLALDKEVKEVHKDNLISLKEDFQAKMNLILALIALVSILPIYDRIMSARTLSKIKAQEEELNIQKEALNQYQNSLDEERRIRDKMRFEDLEEHNKLNLQSYQALGEINYLTVVQIGGLLEKCNEDFIMGYLKNTIDYSLKAIGNFIKSGDIEGVSKSLSGMVVYQYILEKRGLEGQISKEKIEELIIKEFKINFNELKYVQDNFEKILKYKKEFWTEKNKNKLSKLLKKC